MRLRRHNLRGDRVPDICDNVDCNCPVEMPQKVELDMETFYICINCDEKIFKYFEDHEGEPPAFEVVAE